MQHAQIRVRLDKLLMDPEVQIRNRVRPQDVKEYTEAMRAGDVFPPILVALVDQKDLSKGHVLIDGWHRVRASQALGKTEVEALVHPEGDRAKYRWIAAKMNQTHGIRLTREERREVFRAYVKAGEHLRGERRGTLVKSARQMAVDLKGIVSHRRIPAWMSEDFPFWFARMEGLTPEAENPEADWRTKDMDPQHAMLAKSAIEQFILAVSLIRSKEHRKQAVAELVRAVHEVRNDTPDKGKFDAELEEYRAGGLGEF